MSKALVLTCLLGAAMAAAAQSSPPPVPPVPHAPPVPPVPSVFAFNTPDGVGEDVMMFVSSEFGGRSVIKGAPYTANAISETRQVLSDGNRIERSSTMKLYRDSQGRTRQEQSGGVVFINDVVAGKRYVLNTQRKSARELRHSPRMHAPPVPPVPLVSPSTIAPPQPPKPHSQMTPEESRSWAEEMRRWGRQLAERMRGDAGHARDGVVTRNVTLNSSGASSSHVEVIRMDGGNAMPPLPPMAMSPSSAGTTTALGERDFGGVRAQGSRTTWTITAGRIGNKLPIEVVSERWHSPELNLVVLSRYADPRSGERMYRLESISRDEPNAELFKVPADYSLKSPPQEGERK